MKLLKYLILALTLYASDALAQTTGYLVRTDCGTVTNPMEFGVACLQSTTVSGRTEGHIYVYRSGVWTDVDSGGGASIPAGSNGQVQFNNAGVFGADSGLSYNSTTDVLTVTGGVTANLTGNVTGNVTGTLSGNASTATALSANPANCSAGNAPLGIAASGAVESCFDVFTQAEADAHTASTTAHSATSANTASRIVSRDASGNFSAGTITATLSGNVTGNVTGNASTATALAANGTNCGAGEAAAGVDASGNAEGCTSVGGGGGTPVVLDLGNDASNESADLAKITTTGDTNSIFTEPNANELRIAVGNKWPASNTADALAANGSNCSAGQFPLGVDASGAAESCTALPTTITGTANQITASASTGAITLSIPSSPTLPGTTSGTFSGNLTGTVTGNASTATALAANGANCSAGNSPLGVDASGAAEGCFDIATQTELDAHTSSVSAHSAASTNTANRIVLRDSSGNFAAGTITATFTGNVTGNLTGNVTGGATWANSLLRCNPAGASDTYTCTVTPTLSAYTNAMILLTPDVDNDGDATVNVDSLGAVSILRLTGDALSSGDLVNGQPQLLVYDGTNFRLTREPAQAPPTPNLSEVVTAGNTWYGAVSPTTGLIAGSSSNSYVTVFDDATLGPRVTCVINGVVDDCNKNTKLNSGFSKSDIDSAGDAIRTVTESTGLLTYPKSTKRPRKSVYFPAGALSTDGTQCAAPAEVTINSGAKRWTIICADNDGSTIYGEAQMPDAWDGGTVTLMGSFIQTAADTSNLNADVAMACRRDGDTINNTWGTEIAMDTAMGGSNKIDTVTTAAITPDGTCTGGSTLLQFRWQLDAGGTTTAVATLHVLGFKLEYAISAESD